VDPFDLDNSLNYSVQPLSESPTTHPPTAAPDHSRASKQAAQILTLTRCTRGYGLILGCHDSPLAYELARQSQLTVFGVGTDSNRLARARTALAAAGAYGPRILLRHVPSPTNLPFPRSFANLITLEDPVAPDRLPDVLTSLLPWLQPATGTACLGPFRSTDRTQLETQVATALKDRNSRWSLEPTDDSLWLLVRRILPADTGSWTHQYGDAGNSADSKEGLQGVADTGHLAVQWLGRPGADFGVDRNPRMPAPLAINGRLFHQGLNRIVALDSYNGAVLWSLEIPALRRVNLPRDTGNWCADPNRIFVAIENRCWALAADTGDLTATFPLPKPALAATHDWGFVARAGALLYGSSVKRGAVYTNFWGKASWYDGVVGAGTEKVCSDDLFALDSSTGTIQWRYRNGVILNSTIAMASDRVLFVECRNPEIATLTTGRIGSAKLWEHQHLVALNAQTGAVLWQRPIETAHGTVVFYLLADGDRTLLMASTAGKYHLYAFRSHDGADLWQAAHDWPRDNHGGHMQHPVALRNAVYLEPCAYDASTGRLLTRGVGRHGGCATYSATSRALIYRGEGGRISMWDVEHETVSSWYNLRPSCWLSTIPANGMVLSPEGGGGCSCGNWLETSIGFAPIPSDSPHRNP
jgi:outer membrane protein assembly factor BamB